MIMYADLGSEKELVNFNGLKVKALSENTIEVGERDMLHASPIVSIIMMTYNQASYIAEAMEGVLTQNVDFGIELLVGEDCSTDGTREIVIEYAKRYPGIIRGFFSTHNIGGHSNALRLESAGRGKYYAYCDGDDFWHNPDKLKLQVHFLEKNPEYALVHARRHTLDSSNNLQLSTQQEKGEGCKGWVYDELLYANFISACTVCIRASLIKEFGQSELGQKPYLVGDWPRWLYASRRGKIEFINEAVSTYRLSPSSVTRSGDKATLRIKLNQREIQRDFMKLYGVQPLLRRKIEWCRNNRVLSLAMIAGDREVFYREFGWMLKHHPGWLLDVRNIAHAFLFLIGLDKTARVLSNRKRHAVTSSNRGEIDNEVKNRL